MIGMQVAFRHPYALNAHKILHLNRFQFGKAPFMRRRSGWGFLQFCHGFLVLFFRLTSRCACGLPRSRKPLPPRNLRMHSRLCLLAPSMSAMSSWQEGSGGVGSQLRRSRLPLLRADQPLRGKRNFERKILARDSKFQQKPGRNAETAAFEGIRVGCMESRSASGTPAKESVHYYWTPKDVGGASRSI